MAVAPVPPVPTSPTSSAPAPVTPPLSEGARLLNTIIAPSKTFTDLRYHTKWWSWVAPWIVISIFTLLFMYAIQKQVTFEQVSKNQVEHSKRAEQFDKLPADQQEKQLQFSAKIVAVFLYGSPFLILFYALIATVALWATFKIGAAADTTFGQTYAIVMYSWLPGIIGGILGTVSLFAGVNPEAFDINNPVGTNLAYYLDPETTGKFVRSFASSLDVLSIWTVVLIGIGFACTSKVKRSTAIGIVAGWYVAFKLIAAGLATLS